METLCGREEKSPIRLFLTILESPSASLHMVHKPFHFSPISLPGTTSWLPSVFRPLFIPCSLPFPYHPHQCPYFKSLVYLKHSWMYDFPLEWGWLTKDCNKDYTSGENCLSLPQPATNRNQQLHDLGNSIVNPISFSMLWVWFTWAHIATWFQFYDSVIWCRQ